MWGKKEYIHSTKNNVYRTTWFVIGIFIIKRNNESSVVLKKIAVAVQMPSLKGSVCLIT